MTANIDQWSALVGFFLPLIVAFVQRQTWSDQTRTLVGTAACAVAALVTALIEKKLNVHNFAQSAITVFLMTKASYLAFWKKTGITQKIEGKTTPTTPTPSPTT